jgi:peptidyl-tRNA hydrolase
MPNEALNAASVAALMVGGIDIHIHANPHLFPDIHVQDVLELAAQAHQAGMRALVVKDVGVSTTGTAWTATRVGPGIPIYGAHVMNLASGGINPRAVWVALHHGDGAKVVHFPTGDTRNHFDYRKRFYSGVNLALTEEQAISVLRAGELMSEVREIIAMVRECDAALATSHLSAAESHAVIREAKNQGLKKIIVSHARWAMTGLTMSDLLEFAALGCFIEFEFCLMMPIMHFVHGEPTANPLDTVGAMRAVGIERCFISSDLGQLYSPPPVEGMRTYVAILRKCGVSEGEIRTMFHRNPARIIGLE